MVLAVVILVLDLKTDLIPLKWRVGSIILCGIHWAGILGAEKTTAFSPISAVIMCLVGALNFACGILAFNCCAKNSPVSAVDMLAGD